MPGNYRDNYYGSILDPLHGDIKLSEIEKWCISQPVFSRLRKVKQNTFLYYVFPSANHTRFEHSIGVMHLAGRIFDSCKENYATGEKKKEKYSLTGYAFFDLNLLGDSEEVFYQELRLAALLHDVGHGPLSHLFDTFAISSTSFLRLVDGDKLLCEHKKGFESLKSVREDKVEHEVISCAFIFKLIHELKITAIDDPHKFSDDTKSVIGGLSAGRIVKLIEPEFSGLEEFEYKDYNYTTFFSRIITAFPIDADRMDYLLRDSYFSGVTYGVYDITRIFSSFIAAKIDNKICLSYKESGLDSILRFIQSRSHLYNQVYFHKTNRSANTMLSFGTAIGRAGKVKLLDKADDFTALIKFYTTNSDEYFLNTTVLEKISADELEQGVVRELIERKLFKRVFQIKIVLSGNWQIDKEEIDSIKKEIDEKLKKLCAQGEVFAASDKYENETYKDAKDKAILIARKVGKGYRLGNNWCRAGVEFSLADMNVLMIRIYLRRTFTNSKEYEAFKKEVLAQVQPEIDRLTAFGAQ